MSRTIISLFFLIALHIQSCDYVYVYKYQIENLTKDTILVKYSMDNYQDRTKDSFISIAPKELSTLSVHDHGIEQRKGPFNREINKCLKQCLVLLKDSTNSKRNYLENSVWLFHQGIKKAIVTDSEF